MHAWLCEDPTGVDALTWKELPTPQPEAGEVLVEIKAASLNFPDLLIVQNKYQISRRCLLCRAPNTQAWCRRWVKASNT
jgi:NADPH:quinone reductase-like Zn-dependent oxidoreductase